ncbi:hypothetical protein UFOVP531_56 [uncultured Caudovirales phage]|uniref:DUF5675 domain-containing protein n=1 Tax=uncultured Caudovirales phage TaxID=2100421 RepID=A0A6J5MW47_9CAUD|nr:hypothetical protein UFOVP531_56 [uncultured Caudovirales phage]
MKIEIKRLHKTANSTIGELLIDGVWECYTLEDIERDIKIKSETAIPRGTYKVIINQSNRLKRLLPLLLNVPNFEGVRIHAGNTNHDTEGCILVGQTRSKDFIGQSRKAFEKLFAKMQKAKEITLTIS